LFLAFERYKNLAKWSVLEIECGKAGGLDYISNYLKPKKCVGTTSSAEKV
jgi:hypothetical protein